MHERSVLSFIVIKLNEWNLSDVTIQDVVYNVRWIKGIIMYPCHFKQLNGVQRAYEHEILMPTSLI